MSDEGTTAPRPAAGPAAPPGSPAFPEPTPTPSRAPGTLPTGGPAPVGGWATTAPAAPAPAVDEREEEPGSPDELKAPRTRTSATYIGVAVGLLILVLIIIFIAQNLSKASVHFLSFHFKLPQGLIVLAAAVAGGLIVLLVSLARVLQLRLMARRHRRAHDRP
jgi:uncharacterized integral membrane protein